MRNEDDVGTHYHDTVPEAMKVVNTQGDKYVIWDCRTLVTRKYGVQLSVNV